MISESLLKCLKNNSAIRDMFEEGKRLEKEYGKENVYDFSLGNPSVPAPESVNKSIKKIVEQEDSIFLHGYMSNAGYQDVRLSIAENLNKRFGTAFNETNIIMTVGAAGGMNVVFKSILNPGDEVITFSPFFGEYRNYVANFGGKLVELPANPPTFMPDITALKNAINEKTKAVIINNPNNPTGVVYPESVIKEIAACLEEKEKELGTDIVLVSDEPYRELAYDGVDVPYLTKYYHNTVVGYSYSKSLSLPGERIGYLVVPDEIKDAEDLKEAFAISTRILGFVNAPSLMQRVIKENVNESTDVEIYDKNRKALYEGLIKCGFECVKPDGAFYVFLKSPEPDEREFVKKAKEYNLLLVAGRAFGCEGYVRLAYCTSYEKIVSALPYFKKLAEDYGLEEQK